MCYVSCCKCWQRFLIIPPAARTEFFDALFLFESQLEDYIQIKLEISRECFEFFLLYLYTGNLKGISNQLALELLCCIKFFLPKSSALELSCMAVISHYSTVNSFNSALKLGWALRDHYGTSAERMLSDLVSKLRWHEKDLNEILSKIDTMEHSLFLIRELIGSERKGLNTGDEKRGEGHWITEQDTIQCCDRRARYIVDHALSIISGIQIGSLREILAGIREYGKTHGLLLEQDICCCDEAMKDVFVGCDLLEIKEEKVMFPLIATHVTKLPFSL